MSKFKIVFMGDSEVGKTSIVQRFTQNTFSESEKPQNQQKGINVSKDVTIETTTVKLEIVDLAFDVEATSSDFASAHCCVGVYDYSNPESLQNVRNFIGMAARFVTDDKFLKVMCGNKIDLEKKLNDSEVDDMMQRIEISKKYDVSAKSGAGIDEMFTDIARTLVNANAPAEKGGKKKKEKSGSKKCVLF